ncbi:OmpA family protein [Hasllibacter sp. MH4015]|uniref:OmpA family protein n=1 Tax=Hasllibacter sp. MH4015 TaxID=2854029 RepID=UPI001CD29FC9|nr:OmpA family protein [Hasllibacter sp. MH4015]
MDGLPTAQAEGMVQEFIWQISGDGVSTTTLLMTLRDQLEAQGFDIGFSCADRACGGFDFRHALPVGNAPEMHVDLGDFRYLTARAEREDGEEHLALMISQGGATGFVHLALVQPASSAAPPVVASTSIPELDADPALTDADIVAEDLIGQLTRIGSAPLDDLQFQTGASALSGERYASLLALANYLAEDPERRVVLVGHSDAEGSLSGNIALSEARANAVRRFMTQELGVSASQVEAQGIGFLAPRATNTTAEGRESNRRVEVVLADPG